MALGPVMSKLNRSTTNGRTPEYLAQGMRVIRKGAGSNVRGLVVSR
jgi:hypothetical protein